MATTGPAVWDETFTAAADLSAKQFYFVEIVSGGVNVCSAAADRAIGILQDAPKSGEAARVRILGRSKLVTNGSGTQIAAGDAVGPADGGKGVKKATADYSMSALADGASAADGTVISVLLLGPTAFRSLAG
ncbi:MAG: hypothetical protein U0556_09935 [Dehalococcoidia bacterium]